MGLRSWVGTEPVKVDQVEVSQQKETLLRYSASEPIPVGVIRWLTPPSNSSWKIESLVGEVQADATPGNRILYVYVRDRDGKISRHAAVTAVPNSISYFLQAPGCGTGSIVPGPTTNSCPLFATVLDPPCALGLMFDGTDGPGDIRHFYLWVREVSKI